MFKLAVFLDKLANSTLFLGRHWQTISARSWLAKVKGRTWGVLAVRLIDGVFGPGHCQAAAEG